MAIKSRWFLPACLVTIVLTASYTVPAPALADPGHAAFDTLEAGLQYTGFTGEDTYHSLWKDGYGLNLWALTPFYAGDVELGLRYLFNRGGQPEYPDYHSLFPYLGWSYPLAVTGRISIHPGAALGANIMSFDTNDGAGLRYETEAAVELFVRLGVQTHGRWRINAVVGWQRMFTWWQIDQYYISAGLSRSFSMPDGLRGFLE